MKLLNYLLGTLATVWLMAACTTPKNVVYFQDVVPGETEFTEAPALEIRLRPKDEIYIQVHCQDSRLTELFNINNNGQSGYSGTNRNTGYLVDLDGNINFPVLGKLHVAGLTREEVMTLIHDRLESENLAKEPVVTVQYLNLYVNVLGDVGGAGRCEIDKDHMTLIDVLSESGDLQLTGKRRNVMVLRNEDGVRRAYTVDLCSAESVYSSPVYFVQQDDQIYVEPNGTKIRSTTVNGTLFHSFTFWLSMASTISSLCVLIFR